MSYAITALFDAGTEDSLAQLRASLVEAGYGDPLAVPVRPHLTLEILDALDAEAVRGALRSFCYEVPPLAIHIGAVGTFPSSEGVVYLAPVVTPALLSMHARLYEVLGEAAEQAMDTYRPHNWVPHCTLAINLTPDQVMSAIGLIREADVFHTASLVQVAVAQFPPLELLYAFPLRGEQPEGPPV